MPSVERYELRVRTVPHLNTIGDLIVEGMRTLTRYNAPLTGKA